MAAKMNISSTLPLPALKLQIPRLGFGVYRSDGQNCIDSVKLALKAGYPKIDSAQFYRNEELVGAAVEQSGVSRDQVWLTTKILSASGGVDGTYKRIADSVGKIGGKSGYVDLFLMHTAFGDRKTVWQALEKAHQDGLCRAIGVSNWGIGHLEEAKGYAKVWPPHVNQIELHPWCQQREIVKYCQENGIVVEAYCPLVRGMKMKDPTLLSVAKKHNKGPGEVLVRYCLQKDWSPLPKSDTPSRIESNAAVYDFELGKDDMEALDGLDQGDAGSIVESVVN